MTKQWKLVVTPLSGTTPLHQFEFEGGNWMAALRDARQELGEDGGLPSGASCTVAPDGTVTILDPEARRRFLLTPIVRSGPAAQAAAGPAEARNAKGKFQTMAYAPSPTAAQRAPRGPDAQAAQPAAAGRSAPPRQAPQAQQQPARTPIPRADTGQPERKRAGGAGSAPIAGGAVSAPITGRAGSVPIAGAAAAAAGRQRPVLDLLISRDAEPAAENPLSYRERAYVIPRGMSVTDAEAALRYTLAALQSELAAAPRGKLINLAAFDHTWTDRPQRPPLVAIEWRDWRGEPVVDYPAAEDAATPMSAEGDERLAAVFESLHELSHLRTPAEGLEFAVRLLGHAVASDALTACLYDINTDELRIVAALGKGASGVQGKAIARARGLFGRASQLEHSALVINDVDSDASYEPASDGRPGLTAASVLLRSVTHEGRLLGMLQLINRTGGPFTGADVHLVNYVAERLAEFLRDAKARVRH